jgi:3-isopropylmalate/(R)-2-methylmalate dehydratase large subunit
MPMTITEKILAKHCRKTEVKEGEFIEVDIDVLLGNDITAPLAIEKFREWGGKRTILLLL